LQLIGGDLDGVKKERQAIRSKIKQIDDVLKAIDIDIQSLQAELLAVTQKREQAFESIQKLRKQRDEGVCFAIIMSIVYSIV
jgi:archaellum component FlaC